MCFVCFVWFVCFWHFVCVFSSLKPPKTPLEIDAKTSQFFLYFVCFQLFKTIQNTSQNRCQNLPKSSPRRSKIEVWWGSAKNMLLSPIFSAPGGRLGASWGRLGPVLGSSWGRLGSLGASWERLGRVLGPSWDVSEVSWGAFHCHFNLKAILNRFWLRKWTLETFKNQ